MPVTSKIFRQIPLKPTRAVLKPPNQRAKNLQPTGKKGDFLLRNALQQRPTDAQTPRGLAEFHHHPAEKTQRSVTAGAVNRCIPSSRVTAPRPNSASCAPSTGVTQQSTPANRSTHTASGRLPISAPSSSISPRAASLPGASPRLQCRAAQSSRPTTAHTPCQNFSSSAPTASQRPSAQR